MRCPIQSDNPDILLDYASRKLSPSQQALIEQHIDSCPECLRFAEAQKTVWDALDVWESTPVPADFDQKLYARIESHERSAWWKRIFADHREMFSWKPAVSVAGACAALFVGLVLYNPSGNLPGPKAQVIETVEIDQVEATLEDLEMLKQLSSPAGSQDL